jgi:hypothetical protein
VRRFGLMMKKKVRYGQRCHLCIGGAGEVLGKDVRTRLVPEAAFSSESMITRDDLGSSSSLSLNVPMALLRCVVCVCG